MTASRIPSIIFPTQTRFAHQPAPNQPAPFSRRPEPPPEPPTPPEKNDNSEVVIQHLAETVVATAAAVDVISERVDLLAQQLQQQDCQIFALGEEIETANTQQQRCLDRVDRLTQILEATAHNLLTTLPFSETAKEI